MATKAQIDQEYRDRDIMRPGGKLPADVLQKRLGQKSVKFRHKTDRKNVSRGAKKANAIREQW